MHFLLVEGNTTGTGAQFVDRARALGFDPVLAAADPSRYRFPAEEKVRVVQTDTADLETLTSLATGLADGLAGVCSSSEYFVETAARLARALGLPGPDPGAVAICRNKHWTRRALEAGGVPIPAYRLVSTMDEARAAADSLGLPVVVKPIDGTGSALVRLCRTKEEAVAHAVAVMVRGVNERGMPAAAAAALIEQYVEGPEFSVETFHGEVIGITAKHVSPEPYFVETGHDFPARLSPDQENELKLSAVQALRSTGFDWGPAHTEARLSHGRAVVIEVNPRLAGGYIPELVRLATGIDLVRETVAAAAGMPAQHAPLHASHASIRFAVCDRGGMMRPLDAAAARGLDSAIVDVRSYKSAATMVEVCHDFRDRVGHVIAASPDPFRCADAVSRGSRLLAATLPA